MCLRLRQSLNEELGDTLNTRVFLRREKSSHSSQLRVKDTRVTRTPPRVSGCHRRHEFRSRVDVLKFEVIAFRRVAFGFAVERFALLPTSRVGTDILEHIAECRRLHFDRNE